MSNFYAPYSRLSDKVTVIQIRNGYRTFPAIEWDEMIPWLYQYGCPDERQILARLAV